jgi:uncharacterized membrane protein YphA (DoxX/SURF4 family)
VRQVKESYAGWIGLLARVVVGGVWLVAGLLKLPDPAASVRAVRAYQLLPEAAVTPVGYLLPLLEVALGLLLLVGLLTRAAGLGSSALLLAFVFGIAAAWARGLEIECGCFGGDGGASAGAKELYPWEIARDIGLLLLSAWLVWRPVTRIALDSALFRPAESRTTEGISDGQQVR